MWAFDLDGVLIPDCDQIPTLGGVKSYLELSMFMRPLFQPKGDYYIITGRSRLYRDITIAWCEKYLDRQPKILFHDCKSTAHSHLYKSLVILDHAEITHYVESDLNTAKVLTVLTACTKINVLHFGSHIGDILA